MNHQLGKEFMSTLRLQEIGGVGSLQSSRVMFLRGRETLQRQKVEMRVRQHVESPTSHTRQELTDPGHKSLVTLPPEPKKNIPESDAKGNRTRERCPKKCPYQLSPQTHTPNRLSFLAPKGRSVVGSFEKWVIDLHALPYKKPEINSSEGVIKNTYTRYLAN